MVKNEQWQKKQKNTKRRSKNDTKDETVMDRVKKLKIWVFYKISNMKSIK